MKTTTKPKKQVRVEDEKFLLVAPEISVFMACFGLVNELKLLHAKRETGLSEREFDRRFNGVLAQFCAVADSTYRFDLLLPVVSYGRFSPSFWRWFNWWDDYLKAMPPLQISHVEWLAMERSPDVNEFHPPGNWIAHRSDPAFTILSEA